MCARLSNGAAGGGRAHRLGKLAPLTDSADCFGALRCLSDAFGSGGAVALGGARALLAPRRSGKTAGARLDLSLLATPPATSTLSSGSPTQSVQLQAQAEPLLRVLMSSSSPISASWLPKGWPAIGRGAALLHSMFKRSPLPAEVRTKVREAIANKPAGTARARTASTEATSFQLSGCSKPDINGEYVRTGTEHNDRPVYKKAQRPGFAFSAPIHVFLSRTGSARPHDHAVWKVRQGEPYDGGWVISVRASPEFPNSPPPGQWEKGLQADMSCDTYPTLEFLGGEEAAPTVSDRMMSSDGRQTLRVSGAGSSAANGLYTKDGEYRGAPKYVHEDGQLWMLRYTLRSGAKFWYIADKDRLDVDPGDLYRIRSDADEPPTTGEWSNAHDGQSPPPTLEWVDDAPAPPPEEAAAAAAPPPPTVEETAWETASWSLAQDAQLAALVQLIATKKARSPTTLKADDFATVEPMQMLRFELLQPVAADALHARCVVLCELSAAVADHLLPWVDLSASGAAGSLAHELCALKPLIFSKAKERFWAKLKETTKKEGNQPRLRFDRHKANRAVEAREAAAAAGGKGAGGGGGGAAAARLGSDAAVGGAAAESTLFEQLLEQIDGLSSSGFRRAAATSGDGEHRGIDVSMLASSEKAFSVSFVSEAGQDAGGPYRETLDNLCAELHSAALPLLVHTPNATQLNALDRDKRMLNPAARSAAALRQFELMGALIGIALRTNAPLPFELSGYTWKLLLGEAPNVGDLARIDRDTASLLVRVRDNKDPNSPDMSPEMFDGVYSWMDFTFTRSDGLESVELKPGGAQLELSFANRHEWCALVEESRRAECAAQVAAVRRGMAQLVPAAALALFTAEELERMVCGESDWSVDHLRKHAQLRGGLTLSSPSVQHLWAALADMNREERELFLRFTWGRSRMPGGEPSQRFQVDQLHVHGDPDAHLPTSSTCFFSLHWPAYTTAAAAKEKLLYALYNCRDMDLN